MMYSSALNIAGLVMNMFGVVMLFFFAMPYRTRTGGYSSYIVEESDPKVVRAEAWYDVVGWLGLALMMLGTAAQIGAILS
jgi:hypothetical protein